MPRGRELHWGEMAPAAVDVVTARMVRAPSPGGSAQGNADPCASPGLPPRGPDMQQAPPVRSIPSPRIEKLAASKDFLANSYRLILPAGIGSSVDLPAFELPANQVGWLQTFTQYVLTPDATFYAKWVVQIMGAPVPGFDNVLMPPGIANFFVGGEDDMRVRIDAGQQVNVRIVNLDGSGPWTVGAAVGGWYHPRDAEQRAFGDALDL